MVGNGIGDLSSNPGRDGISYRTNTLGNGGKPIYPSFRYWQIAGQTRLFKLAKASSLGKEKL